MSSSPSLFLNRETNISLNIYKPIPIQMKRSGDLAYLERRKQQRDIMSRDGREGTVTGDGEQ